jgi:alkylation response protein AidB-like acyl-CoA dehydrogenase
MLLTPEQTDFAAAIRDFCRRECGTRAQRDALTAGGDGAHSAELMRRLADAGWAGVNVPEEYGGAGGGAVELCVLLEGLAHGLAPLHGVESTVTAVGPYARFGTEEQKRTVLGGIAAGAVEAIAMSEPGAGSDVGALICRAVIDPAHPDEYVINGQKTWVSNAHIAGHVLLVCRTGAAGANRNRHDGMTMIVIPAGMPGMEIRSIETMRGPTVNDIFFSDCRVALSSVLGADGAAWKQLMTGLNHERLVIAADCLGVAQRAFDDTIAYVKERKQFGRPLGSFQVLRHRLADLATELEATRLLVYATAQQVDANPGTLFPREASMAKLKASELAKRCALEAMQMHGGYGYATEYDIEDHLRRAVATTIYGGTSEIQRDIIGKTFGL